MANNRAVGIDETLDTDANVNVDEEFDNNENFNVNWDIGIDRDFDGEGDGLIEIIYVSRSRCISLQSNNPFSPALSSTPYNFICQFLISFRGLKIQRS